jgi:hypothetical protein
VPASQEAQARGSACGHSRSTHKKAQGLRLGLNPPKEEVEETNGGSIKHAALGNTPMDAPMKRMNKSLIALLLQRNNFHRATLVLKPGQCATRTLCA